MGSKSLEPYTMGTARPPRTREGELAKMGISEKEGSMASYKIPRVELIGKKFGKLQVVAFTHMSKDGRSMWRCQCDCGKQKIVPGSNLVRGDSKSCGCAAVIRFWVHGFGKERLRKFWRGIIYRCEVPACNVYEFYGGRGIRVCDEWRDYTRFRAWAMSNGFKPGLILGRINSAGNYESNNCRWKTRSENLRLAHIEGKYCKRE